MSISEGGIISKSIREILFGLSDERIQGIIVSLPTEKLIDIIVKGRDSNLVVAATSKLGERIRQSTVRSDGEMIIKPD